MQATADTLQVPLKQVKFNEYRNFQRGTAFLGAAMTIMAASVCVYAIYQLWADPAHRSTSVLLLVLSLMLMCGIGAASLSLLRLAQSLSRTLNGNLPALCASQAGIEDNASDSPLGLLRWEEIESITVSARYAQSIRKSFPGMVIVFKDGLQTSGRPYLLSSGMTPQYANKRGVFIPQGRIAMPIEEVVEQIDAFRARMT